MVGRRGGTVAVCCVLVVAGALASWSGPPASAGPAAGGTMRVEAIIEGGSPAGFEPRVRVVCRARGEVVAERTLRFDDARARVIRGIDTPARCGVEQRPTQDELVLYDVDGDTFGAPPRVALEAGETVRVVVTSSFPSSTAVGTIRVTKAVVGRAPDGSSFVVRVRCGDRYRTRVTFPPEGGTEDVAVDIGADPITCRVGESNRGGADGTHVAPASGRVSVSVASPTADVTVTNTFD